ncbi:olfactory receptor class A-like protein 4 [Pholidichthys leucotaenia]
MSEVLTVDAILFGLLVFSGIVGNILVIHVVFQSAFESPSRRLSPSDTILVHLSLANLLTSLFRTIPIFVSDLGLDVSLSPGWCRVFMLLWVWWRAVGCWVTFALSAFHWTILTRHRVTFSHLALKRQRRRVWIVLGMVWGANLAFSIPALVYTTHVDGNATVKLMVISCTTKPLLGCVWEFPSDQQGSAFASISMALNELLPLLLMISTNLATLHSLTKHIRTVTSGGDSGVAAGQLDKHVATERKAAHVIMSLVSLFVVCWTLQVASVTYYNHDGGHHAEGLLTVAHFSASVFIGFSPMVVALGHGKLRRKITDAILGWTTFLNCYNKDTKDQRMSLKTAGTKGKEPIFVIQKEMKVINVEGKGNK